jgi:hypothetical protein
MHKDSKIKNVSIRTDRRSRPASRDEQYGADLFLIKRVIEAYESCISLPTLSTLILNDDGDMEKQKKLLPASTTIDFIVDVQRITTKALNSNTELECAWFKLLSGKEIAPALEHSLVRAR